MVPDAALAHTPRATAARNASGDGAGAAEDRHVRTASITCVALLLAAAPAMAERDVNVGLSELVYLTSFFGRTGTALDLGGGVRLHGAWRVEAGVRIELPSGMPEGFGRISIDPMSARWRPAVGVELGVTARTDLGDDAGQLADAREAANEVSPIYAAFVARPLRFATSRRFVISAVDVQVGTQLSSPGRWGRVQIGLFSIGATL